MSKYLLYGTPMIVSDETLKDFAQSVCDNVLIGDIVSKESDRENYKDEYMDLIDDVLFEDIPRTDVDYEGLMRKYKDELGGLLYDIENHGGEMPIISFWGIEAEQSFNRLIKEYIDIYFDELIKLP